MPEISKIVPGLYIGSRPTDPDKVADRFDVIVFAAEEYQPPANAFHPARIVRAPLDDGRMTQRQITIAMRGALAVDAARRRGEHVLVTCNMGINRSSLIVAMALSFDTGGELIDSIIREIRRNRKPGKWVLDALGSGAKALSNPHFVKFLKSARWREEAFNVLFAHTFGGKKG
jgi:hypothetical protein